jgi:antitoxin component YwqK of YwqJK toxin-antitoxin module
MKRSWTTRRIAAGCSALAIALAVQLPALSQQRSQLQMPQTYQDSSLIDEQNTAAQIQGANGSEVEVVRERYPDGKIRIERQVTQDEQGNYVNHGAWRMLTTKGEVSAEGQYNMGQRVGHWIRWHGRNDSPILNEAPFNRFEAPFKSQANFTDGQLDGDWLITDANDRKVIQVSLKNGQRHGPAVTWLPNGKTFRQATYDQGVPVGDVLEANSKTGELTRVESYVDGRKVTTRTSYHSGNRQKKQTETMYLAATTNQQSPDEYWNLRLAKFSSEGKDLKHGPSKAWFANGRPQFDGFYQYGKRSGTFTYWHENGQVAATGEYQEDQPEGIWVWWHSNGQKSAIGKYQDGALIGEWRWWNEDGKLSKQHEYDGTESISSQDQDTFDIGARPDEAESEVR